MFNNWVSVNSAVSINWHFSWMTWIPPAPLASACCCWAWGGAPSSKRWSASAERTGWSFASAETSRILTSKIWSKLTRLRCGLDLILILVDWIWARFRSVDGGSWKPFSDRFALRTPLFERRLALGRKFGGHSTWQLHPVLESWRVKKLWKYRWCHLGKLKIHKRYSIAWGTQASFTWSLQGHWSLAWQFWPFFEKQTDLLWLLILGHFCRYNDQKVATEFQNSHIGLLRLDVLKRR